MRTRTVLTTATATALLLLTAPHSPASATSPPGGDHLGPASVPDHAVISQAQSRAQHHQTVTEGNAVEIANPTTSYIDLAGWSVHVYDSASSLTASINFALGDKVPSGKSIVIHDPDFQPIPRSDCLTPDRIFEFTQPPGVDDIIPDQFGVALVDHSGDQIDSLATVSGITATALNPDRVGEGSPATALDSGTDPHNASLQRDIFLTDTDDNQDDFQRRAASWGRPFFC